MKRQTIKNHKGGVPPLQFMALKSSAKLAHLALKTAALKSKALNGTLKKGVLLLDDLVLASHRNIRHRIHSKTKKRGRKTINKSKIQKSLEAIPIIINPTEG
jgi:hypothetical protein